MGNLKMSVSYSYIMLGTTLKKHYVPCGHSTANWQLSNQPVERGIEVVPLIRNWSGQLYPRLELKSPQVTSHATLKPVRQQAGRSAARAQNDPPGPSRVTTGSRRQSALVVPRGGSSSMCDATLHNDQELVIAQQSGDIISGVPRFLPPSLFF